MTPEIIYVEQNGSEPLRNELNLLPSHPGVGAVAAPAGSVEPKAWFLRSCRYQVIDRLMILACLITSLTLASWTIAQESSGSGAESGEATVTEESTASEPASETTGDTATADQETSKAESVDQADKATSDKATSDKATSDEATSDEATSDEATSSGEDRAPVAEESIDDNVARALKNGPSWIESPPEVSDGLEAIVVSSDPKVTHEDALASLDANIKDALERYIDNYLGVRHAHTFLPVDVEHYKARLILDEGDRYDKVATYSVGTMHESYAKLTIDDSFRRDIHDRWGEVVTSMRLFRTGGIVAGVLALMLVIFSYLRLDTATRGYYSGRLRMLGGLAILGVIGLAVFFFRYNLEWLQMLINA